MKTLKCTYGLFVILTVYPMLTCMYDLLFGFSPTYSDYNVVLYAVIAWWAFVLIPPLMSELNERKLKRSLNLPKDFKAQWENTDSFPYLKYFAISPTTNQIAFFDTSQKVARVESSDFVTNWELSTTESHTGTIKSARLCVYFDCYETPYMEFDLWSRKDKLKNYKQFEMAMQGRCNSNEHFHPSKYFPEYFDPPAKDKQ